MESSATPAHPLRHWNAKRRLASVVMRLAFDRAVPLSYVAMSDPLPQEAAKQIKAALAAGNKIEAIKICRTFSGASLAEAKDFIEALAAGRAPVVLSRPEAAPGAIEAALFAGKKIAAIKLYREVHGGGLADAKQHIEALEAQLRKTSPESFTAKKGCLVFSAAFLLTAAGLIVAIAS